MIILKRSAEGIIMTRGANEEMFHFYCDIDDQQEVEKRLIGVFAVESDNVIVVDENSILVKMVEP